MNTQTGRKRARWRKDLRFFFSGGIVERASLYFTEETPVILVTNFKDAVMCLTRLGIVTQSHLRQIEDLPNAPGGQELRIMEEFTSRLKVHGARQYTVFASVWFFKNQGKPLDGTMLIGIAPVGAEALVQAKVKAASDSVKASLKSDATAVLFERGSNNTAQSN